jgi:hypothetical protein
MKFDRKLLLIAPAIVLVFIVAGIVYAGIELRSLTAGENTWNQRREFVAAVAAGQKAISAQQAIGLLTISLEVEGRRAAALHAAYDLLFVLAAMTAACCVVLVLGIRRVPREHWPRFNFRSAAPAAAPPVPPAL